jgi:3-carboxy-cis,cis-muconate cycloisomerase
VLVAAAARQLPALGSVLAAAAAPEQERPAGAWHAEWQPLRTMLRLAAGAAERTADLVPRLHLDQEAMARNLDLLLGSVGQDRGWAVGQVAEVGVWIDRVLGQHEEVIG